MDSLITAAARALAAGDLLGALNRVALRDDPFALALRGIVEQSLQLRQVRARRLVEMDIFVRRDASRRSVAAAAGRRGCASGGGLDCAAARPWS